MADKEEIRKRVERMKELAGMLDGYHPWIKDSIPQEDGSRLFRDGTKRWINSLGYLHREDGPAVIHRDGREEFWINGDRVKK